MVSVLKSEGRQLCLYSHDVKCKHLVQSEGSVKAARRHICHRPVSGPNHHAATSTPLASFFCFFNPQEENAFRFDVFRQIRHMVHSVTNKKQIQFEEEMFRKGLVCDICRKKQKNAALSCNNLLVGNMCWRISSKAEASTDL